MEAGAATEPGPQAHAGRAATLVVAILIPVNVIDVRVEHAALPLTRNSLRDTRYHLGWGGALLTSLVLIPWARCCSVAFLPVTFPLTIGGATVGLLISVAGLAYALVTGITIYPSSRLHPRLSEREETGDQEQVQRAGSGAVARRRRQ